MTVIKSSISFRFCDNLSKWSSSGFCFARRPIDDTEPLESDERLERSSNELGRSSGMTLWMKRWFWRVSHKSSDRRWEFMRRKFWLSGGGGVDKDREVAEDELGESIEAADAVLETSETEVGELLPSPFGSMFSFSSFTNSKYPESQFRFKNSGWIRLCGRGDQSQKSE